MPQITDAIKLESGVLKAKSSPMSTSQWYFFKK